MKKKRSRQAVSMSPFACLWLESAPNVTAVPSFLSEPKVEKQARDSLGRRLYPQSHYQERILFSLVC